MMIDLNTVLAWHPCPDYPRERLEKLYATPKTPREVLTITAGQWAGVPPWDRLWTVLHEGVLPDRVLRLFSCMTTERALCCERAAGREPNADSWRAVAVARKFANGDATEAELHAAEMAAAAENTAWEALALTARAARAAGAARAATERAALAAAHRSALWRYGHDAEYVLQLKDLLLLMDKENL